MKDKIAFVVIRYGRDINGGAEQHCRMLAERMAGRYDVEVLTTCIRNYRTGGNEFPAGEELIDGVLVRRFPADLSSPEAERYYARMAKRSRRFRHLLYRPMSMAQTGNGTKEPLLLKLPSVRPDRKV